MTRNKDCTKYLSEMQELNISRAIDGRRTPMSGAGNFIKGDIVTKTFEIEAKTQMTEKKSFSVKKEWIDKLKEESFMTGKPNWSLAFNFGGEINQKDNYYIIPERLFILLKQYLED